MAKDMMRGENSEIWINRNLSVILTSRIEKMKEIRTNWWWLSCFRQSGV